MSVALLAAECYLLLNCLGYLANVWRVRARGGPSVKPAELLPEMEEYPPLAIVVSSYNLRQVMSFIISSNQVDPEMRSTLLSLTWI